MAPVGSGEGNTKTSPTNQEIVKEKRINGAKRWLFTWNNYPDNWLALLAPIFEKSVGYIFGHEVGKKGTKHIQGYIEFKEKVRPIGYLGIPKTIHWGDKDGKAAKGSKESNIVYCSKDGNVDEASTFRLPREIKFPDSIGTLPWQLEILKIIKTEPDDRTIHWFWSHEGGLGKTTFTKWLQKFHGACMVAGKGNDVRNGVLTWVEDKGDYPELVIFPIPRTFNTDYLSYEALENIKDMCFYSGKFKGGQVCGPCPHVVIFANVPPTCDEEFMKRICVNRIDTKEGTILEEVTDII